MQDPECALQMRSLENKGFSAKLQKNRKATEIYERDINRELLVAQKTQQHFAVDIAFLAKVKRMVHG